MPFTFFLLSSMLNLIQPGIIPGCAADSDSSLILQEKTSADSVNLYAVQDSIADSDTSLYLQPLKDISIEPFPILMYDTDIGFGYGVKLFILNMSGLSESIDILAFNSTKGERWYRLVLSIPDAAIRQGKFYPFAIDLIVDYDKLIKSNFFGTGNNSRSQDREEYTREVIDASVAINRGFSKYIVGEIGSRQKSVKHPELEKNSKFLQYGNNYSSSISMFSVFTAVRYDSRNSFINPEQGIVIQIELEKSVAADFSYLRYGISVQHYYSLFPKTILASRAVLRHVPGEVPVQMLLSLGGNSTLRGFPQDRFLDKAILLLNNELRFPVYGRFGGLIGIDAGRVFDSLENIGSGDFKYNIAAGLRLYMDTFVVRLDTGFSKESMGLYFNFGHIF